MHLLDNTQINQLNLEQNAGLKKMMIHVQGIWLVVKLYITF